MFPKLEQVFKFTEVRKGGSKSPLRSIEERFDAATTTPSQKRHDVLSTPSQRDPSTAKRVIESKTVTFKNSPIVKTVFAHVS